MTCSYQLNHHYKFDEDYSFFYFNRKEEKKSKQNGYFVLPWPLGIVDLPLCRCGDCGVWTHPNAHVMCP